MKTGLYFSAVLFFAVALGSIYLLAQDRDSISKSVPAIILYYGDGCPHCEIVEEYLQKNDPADKLAVVQKEVWNDPSNKKEFIEKASACGLDTGNLGVPMLWDQINSKCYMGDQPIIDFLNQLIDKPQ